MPPIKPLDKTASLWAKRAAASRDEYLDGVRNPRRDWERSTLNSVTRYQEGLEASFANKSFQKGIQEAGTKKWQDKSVKLGPGRYSEGVRIAESDYREGFAPFHDVISKTTLPPRGPKGSPENIDRVRVIAEALHNQKIGR